MFLPQKPQSNRRRSRPDRGFALIVTLSLMILLTVIAVGLLSLSAISLRASSANSAQQQAQANARMALMLAIGDLQRTMGPDTRVSANAKILEKSGTNVVDDNLEQVTGVWEAWRPSPENIGAYDQKKTGATQAVAINPTDGLPQPMGGFHRWLVSTGDPKKSSRVDFPTSGTLATPTSLVNSPSAGQPGVQAEKIKVLRAPNNIQGMIAWAVFDEGQKAAANLGNPVTTGTALEQLGNQDTLALENVTEWAPLAALTAADRAKFPSYESTKLAGNSETGRFSYDMTASTSGVLADVTLGKLRTDLSLLFANNPLPTEYSDRYLYSNTTTPIAAATSRGSHPYVWPAPDPKWSLLYKFYRISDNYGFSADGKNASIAIDFTKIPDRLNATGTGANAAYNDELKLSPVISKAQFFFSLTFCRDAELGVNFWPNTGGQTGGKRGTSEIVCQVDMIIDPVITLWNPYDVPIKVPEFHVYLYRIPIKFKFDVTNTAGKPPILRKKAGFEFTEFIDLVRTSGNTAELAYPLIIKPSTGQTTINMDPGEHLVCSIQDCKATANILDGTGAAPAGAVLMQPGWKVPNASGPLVSGAITSENLFRDTNGAVGAEFLKLNKQWEPTRGLPVRADDQISITVAPVSTIRGNFATLGSQPVDFYLRYGNASEPISGLGGERADYSDFGAIELDYGPDIANYLKTFSSSTGGAEALPTFPINKSDILNAPVDGNQLSKDASGQYRAVKMKKPFLVATLHLKSLIGSNSDIYRSKFPSKAWIYNNPTALYASNGLGNQMEKQAAHQYEFSLEPLAGTWGNGVPEVLVNGAGKYVGTGGPSPGAKGRAYAPFISIPRVHATSLAQLRHAPLNQSGKLPLQAQVLANSFAHPLMMADTVIDSAKGYLDHSFLANSLFDRTFFSSAKSGQNIVDLATSNTPLVNSRMAPFGNPDNALLTGTENYKYSAGSLLVNGSFNVNSTSVKAWKAFLTAMNGTDIPFLAGLDKTTLGALTNPTQEAHVSRYGLPLDQGLGDSIDPAGAGNSPAWTGYRKLDKTQIDSLATSMVEEVKKRGPFQSIAEFINRRAESTELGQMGGLQAAIELSGMNDGPKADTNSATLKGTEDGSDDYVNKDAAKGSSVTGTPGYLLQGDLLNSMAPFISVRSDTFKIRAYGEATDPTGKIVTARAWCEAVVQRVPDYVDSSANTASDHLGSDSPTPLSTINKNFGRKFQIVSFRWLTPQDI
jgi:type II secretory pathway pseudopilin PulG